MSSQSALVKDESKQISQPRAKKRRAARACERCRAKKYKCDESFPCRKCVKSKVECVYEGDFHLQRDSQAAGYIQELESRIEELNERLREATVASVASNSVGKTSSTSWATPHGPSILNPELSPNSINEDESPSSDALEEEISEVNRHTNAIEFHGNTSSAAALGHLQRAREPSQQHTAANDPNTPSDYYDNQPGGPRGQTRGSLISTLHNPNFSLPQLHMSTPDRDKYTEISRQSSGNNRFYFEYAHVFMEGYFENLHFIHPLIDRENFILQAHNLWFGKDPHSPTDTSFIALYLSLLSLGALIRAWDQPRLGGLTRLEWSRKLFAEAQGYLNTWCFTNNLEIVQALYLMAKICQNELSPHLAYMYLGLAIRTCLSAGYNRETADVKSDQHDWISRTWWGLYSLEIELSFSLGRPDTLGLDEYHNRCQPSREGDSEYAIIPIAVDLAHMIRQVSVDLYHSRATIQQRMKDSLAIEQRLNKWLDGLPKILQPDFGQPGGSVNTSISALRDPKWSRRQRLVLGIRYHNVKMFIFRPFLAYLTLTHDARGNDRASEAQRLLEMAAKKCLDSARKTVEIIYETYRQYTFFRSWWYNTTYIMFAVTNLLLPLSRKSSAFLNLQERSLVIESVHKSIEILEAMDESVVARESVEIVKNHLKEYAGNDNFPLSMTGDQRPDVMPNSAAAMLQPNASDDLAMIELGEMPFDDFLPDLTLSMGSSDYPFESIAGLFGDITGPHILE